MINLPQRNPTHNPMNRRPYTHRQISRFHHQTADFSPGSRSPPASASSSTPGVSSTPLVTLLLPPHLPSKLTTLTRYIPSLLLALPPLLIPEPDLLDWHPPIFLHHAGLRVRRSTIRLGLPAAVDLGRKFTPAAGHVYDEYM